MLKFRKSPSKYPMCNCKRGEAAIPPTPAPHNEFKMFTIWSRIQGHVYKLFYKLALYFIPIVRDALLDFKCTCILTGSGIERLIKWNPYSAQFKIF